jgi:hypothetical protein
MNDVASRSILFSAPFSFAKRADREGNEGGDGRRERVQTERRGSDQ